jgi:glycosyltransferase involved in cell wall biosynthesis
MNLLFLNSATAWGGNEKWTMAAANGLADRGHQVHLGCRSSLFRNRFPGSSVQFVRFPFANNGDPVTILKLANFIRRNRIDLVIPTKQREYLLGGLAATVFHKVKVVARLGIDRPIQKWRNHFAFCRLFDGVIVNSKSIVEVLAKTPRFDPLICKVIYNGIELPAISPEIRKAMRSELGIADEGFAIGGVGRLTYQKGFDLAIEAFALVAARHPEARLFLVGEGASLDQYRRQAEDRGVGNRVVFTGFRTDVPSILQALDLFWLTSRSEGMPNALLEAMAAGRTSVAFAVAGVSELIRPDKEGVVVPFGDTDVLSRETVRLIEDSRRRERMENAAREGVESRFSPHSMVDALEGYLESIRTQT